MKRLHALWLLGSAMVLVILRRLFVRVRPLEAFKKQYGGEGILALTTEESRLLALPSKCTGCGRCDIDGTGRLVLFALAGVRSLPDADAASALVLSYDSATLEKAESLCPEAVPLRSLITLARTHASRIPHPG